MKKLTALLVLAACLCSFSLAAVAASGEVVVYNWSDYIPQDVLNDFTKETGIKVVYSTYESNEAMYAKIKLLKGKSYDVVCPSTYFIAQMIEDELLMPLNRAKLTNMGNIDPKLMNLPFDPQNRYSVPYMWGSAGLIVNSAKVDKNSITSWHDLFRPEFKGKIMLSDDPRDTIGMALLATGSTPNAKDEASLKKAFNFLEKLRPSVRVFDVTAGKRAIVNEEVIIGLIWNGDAQLAIDENEDLAFIYPKEGVPLWADNFAITAGAANVENAHIFINYMLRPKVALRCLEEYGYSTPNLKALKLMDKDLRSNRILNPTAADLKNAVMLDSLGEAQKLYNQYWDKLISGK